VPPELEIHGAASALLQSAPDKSEPKLLPWCEESCPLHTLEAAKDLHTLEAAKDLREGRPAHDPRTNGRELGRRVGGSHLKPIKSGK
jgi:hypothetical protein